MKRPIALVASLLLAAPGACHDSNCVSDAGKAQLVQGARDHLASMQEAEATVRALNDPASATGRARIGKAAAARKAAEDRLHTIETMVAQPQPGCP